MVDPGHGGRDFGAPGYLKGVHEKDITLEIGKRLARKIRAQLGCEVFMTRSQDQYLTLEERTAIANTKNADLFISIHTNASTDRRAFGIETYFLNLATDNDAILVAARENATSTKNISDLQAILNDLMQNAKINESSRLAVRVQESLYEHLKNKRYSQIKSKGVKQAPFYVLLGAQMPAILVETSFISNPRECRRLVNPSYQENLCDAVIKGSGRTSRKPTPRLCWNPRRPRADPTDARPPLGLAAVGGAAQGARRSFCPTMMWESLSPLIALSFSRERSWSCAMPVSVSPLRTTCCLEAPLGRRATADCVRRANTFLSSSPIPRGTLIWCNPWGTP